MAASSPLGVFGDVPAVQTRERRSCARVRVLEDLQQAVFAELGPTRALLLDVCAQGIAIEAVHVIKKAARLAVRFSLPFGRETFEGSCQLVWENGGRTGLRFVQLAPAEQQQLQFWLDTYAKRAAGSGTVAIEAPLPRRSQCDLARVTEEARLLTGADGAALALRDEQGAVCLSSTGNAPSVGFRLQVESGLTGECLRTGELVWCDDMDDDPRVDRAVAKRLQSRSALILPVRAPSSRGPTLGVILVLSSRASAFTHEHIAILHQLCKRIGAALVATEAPSHEVSFKAFPPESVQSTASNSPSTTLKGSLDSFLFPLAETELADETILERGADSEPALRRMTAVFDVIRGFLLAITQTIQSSLRKRISGRMPLVGLLFSVVAGSLLLSWFFFHAQETITAEQMHSGSLQASETTLHELSTKAAPPPLHDKNKESARRLTSRGTADHHHGASKQRDSTVVRATGPVRQLALAQPQPSDTEALEYEVPSTGSLPELSKPTPNPVSPPTSHFIPAQLVYRRSPQYPEIARWLHRSEKVVLKATITNDGTVANVHWVEGNPMLRENVISAIKQWRYKPASLDGQPVESDLEIVLHFSTPAQ